MGSTDASRRHESPVLLALAVVVCAEAAGAATWLILAGHRVLGGLAAAVAAAILVAVLPLAGSPRATFAERMLDRTLEACVLIAVAWVARRSDVVVAALALVGLGASYVAGYERARGEGLGYPGTESAAFRAVRHGLLVLALLSGLLAPALSAFAALVVVAAGVRAANVAVQERRRGAADGAVS